MHENFLQSIREHPEEDHPRLVYADWLEEQGDPRGEFIRVQCELAGLPRSDPRFRSLQRRESELKVLVVEWIVRQKQELGVSTYNWKLRRGFLEMVSMRALDFVACADRLFEHFPTVIHLRLQGVNEVLPALGRAAALDQITTLDLTYNWLGDRGVKQLAQWNHLGRLQTLILNHNQIGDSGAAALTRSPHLTGLRELQLKLNRITDRGAATLARASDWPDLERIDLRENPVTPAGLQWLREQMGEGVQV